jgi:FkbM family methyltransferase
MRPLSEIGRALVGCARIRASPSEYLRVALTNSPGEFKAFGFNVEAPDSSAFAYLYEEIGIYESYVFDARTDRPTIVDCGANIGLATLWFKNRYPRARILAFEPNPEAADVLDDALRRNDIEGVELHRVALGLEEGVRSLYAPLGHRASASASLDADHNPGSVEVAVVEVRRLSSFLPQRVDLPKIDVEGSEHAVLTDLDAAGVLHRCTTMIIEYGLGDRPDLSQVLEILVRNRFRYRIQGERHSDFHTRSNILIRAESA